MSIFNELLPHLFDISNLCTKNLNGHLKEALKSIDKFEEEFQSQNARSKAREKTQKDKNAMITLQSIDEGDVGDDETNKLPDPEPPKHTSKTRSDSQSSTDKRGPKKRSKNEVDDMSSPEQDKRVKRNASVKAQSIISKQVNVNLTQKLRRENSIDKSESQRQSSRSRRQKDDKENLAPPEQPTIQIKQERITIAMEPEPMETELQILPTDLEIKQERHKDDIAMPPPAAPVPKPRKAVPKEKSQEKPQEEASEEEPSRRSRRGTRNKKQADVTVPVPGPRGTRASSRARDTEEAAPAPALEPAARPKRTRGRNKLSQIRADSGNATQSSTESLPASPAEKPRPKRTRRAQKAEKEEEKQIEPEPTISPKEERQSQEQITSPLLTIPKNQKEKALTKADSADKNTTNTQNFDKELANAKHTNDSKFENAEELTNSIILDKVSGKSKNEKELAKTKNGLVLNIPKLATSSMDQVDTALNETRVISKNTEMDQTMILPNGVYNHAPVTPKNIHLNETVVLEKSIILDKLNGVMDATVILEKAPIPSNLTEDNSLLTDDSDTEPDVPNTPPKKGIPAIQPVSAVKEKVQQFEEMATRVTRTKTRAMAKKEEEKETVTETQTPPDKISKAILSTETLSKMNSLIFNGKPPQISTSACKLRLPAPSKQVTASASKAAAISRAREGEDSVREDARQKKEALLEAKRELQKRKREEKMAAAAAARGAAERERRALLQAAARERQEKQLHAELEKNRIMREAERKKQELARKVAETEERRRAEETARQQRLAEEQRRAMEARIKKDQELEAMRREEARMAKEIEKKQREYHEKQKKQKIDRSHPLKPPLTPRGKALPAAHMEDGFQYLNSDEDAEPPERPVPDWSTHKARRLQLCVQKLVPRRAVDAWFLVGARSPDLSDIFPAIERAQLKRTSSAVWRTPPAHRT